MNLNILEARYLFDQKHTRGAGLRIDFAKGDNGQPAPGDFAATNFALRLTYVYSSY